MNHKWFMIIQNFVFFASSIALATNIHDGANRAKINPLMSGSSSSYQRNLRKSRKLGFTSTYPTLSDFFNFTLAITPDQAYNTSMCNTTDEINLQNEVDLVLLNFGAGNVYSYGGMSLSGICPESSLNSSNTSTTGQRRLARRTSYLWTGGGSCRGCNPDNTDMSKVNTTMDNLMRRLADPLISMVVIQLTNIVTSEIVPYHQRCLGVNPLINVTASRIGVSGVASKCNVDTLPTLSVSNLDKSQFFAFQGSVCQACISLDFSSIGSNSQINNGAYVSTHWKNTYGVTINASSSVGGFTPFGQARIYDTSLNVLNGEGNIDLGSPNNNCGGPGVGLGGQLGQTGENCLPIKNALIIQENATTFPKANRYGGNITFEFDIPVFISDIGFIDIDESNQKLVFVFSDGKKETYTYRELGDNAVQRVIANKFRVKKLIVVLNGTAAVTVLNFCPVCSYL